MSEDKLTFKLICLKVFPSYMNVVSEAIFKVGMCLPAGPYVDKILLGKVIALAWSSARIWRTVVFIMDALEEEWRTASDATAYINKLYHVENNAKSIGLSYDEGGGKNLSDILWIILSINSKI